MEIGGFDLILETDQPEVVGQKVRDFLGKKWSEGVEEDSGDIGFGQEYFIFSSSEAQEAWDTEGRTDKYAADMFYIIIGTESVTVVHENEPLMAELMSAILDS